MINITRRNVMLPVLVATIVISFACYLIPKAYAASTQAFTPSSQEDNTTIVKDEPVKVNASVLSIPVVRDIEGKINKKLSYDQEAMDAVGSQSSSGHMICCPGYACAYGDVIVTGESHDHYEYGCGTCMWTNWGGGDSSYRSVGSDEELLREAYDQIKSGKPTVIHVTGVTAEHWICLFGYIDATDPDNLSLSNFWALDPYDGSELIAGDTYSLYGDGCEHITEREVQEEA